MNAFSSRLFFLSLFFLLSMRVCAGTTSATIYLNGLVQSKDLVINLNVDTAVDIESSSPTSKQNFTRRESDLNKKNASFSIDIMFPNDAKRFLVFGNVKDANGKTIQWIPVQLLNREDLGRTDLIKFEIHFEPSSVSAFKASFPFNGPDANRIDDDTVIPILLAVKHIIENDFVDKDPQRWQRIGHFFRLNRRFFSKGSSATIEKILSYLAVYDNVAQDDSFRKYYADFLIAIVQDKLDLNRVFDTDVTLDNYILSTLGRIFREHMPSAFSQTNLAIEAYQNRKSFDECLLLATDVYSGYTDDFLNSIEVGADGRYLNLISALTAGTVCGQKYFLEQDPRPLNEVAAGAQFLAERDSGKKMMQGYVTLIQRLDALHKISRASPTRPKVIWTHFDAYSMALGGM